MIALCIGSTVIVRYSAKLLMSSLLIFSLVLYLTFGGLHLLHSMGQTHLHFLQSIQMLNKLFLCFWCSALDEYMVVARVILIDGAVLTDETAASEAVDLHWFFVLCTHLKCGGSSFTICSV